MSMAMLLVIGNRNYSSWSLRGWLAVKQTGEEFEEVVIPLDQPKTKDEIRRHSPSGRVPALRDGDVTVWDSLAIGEYLAEKFPRAGLWPQDIRARAYARSVVAEMHSGFQALRSQMPMNIRLRREKQMTPAVEQDVARIIALWADCRTRFGRGGAFLFGQYTLADAFFAPVATRLITYGVKLEGGANEYVRSLVGTPAMQEWMDKARKEPWAMPEYDA
jgi:glutathione S-transferase